MDLNKISAYFILYHDLQFLDDIISRIYPYVDEIVIIDGPYTYALELLKLYNLFYDEATRPQELTDIINKYPKIVYKYGTFTCEEEKRMMGYNLCSYNNILLVDSDEFFTMHMDKIRNFINDRNKFVAGFDIYNMNRTNIAYNNKTTKYVFFKRHKICALDHLDYLWLVGCKTKDKVGAYMDTRNALGIMYHQTLNRNKFNNNIKFIFYVSLYFRNTNQSNDTLFNGYKMDELLEKCSIDTLLTIFYHSRIETMGVPSMANTNICVENNDIHTELAKYNNNHASAYFTNDSTLLVNISAYFLIPKNQSNTLRVVFDNVQSINVTVYEVPIGSEYKKHTFNYSNVVNNEIIIEYNRCTHRLLDTVIQFDCPYTLDGSFVYKIKRIE